MPLVDGKTLVIAGAQKAATTAIFHSLCRHSQFTKPILKEPQFLSIAGELTEDAESWYRSVLTPRPGFITIDASTSYMVCPIAARRVNEIFEDPLILIILRDPVQRAFSSYLELWKRGGGIESRAFGDIIATLESEDLKSTHFQSVERQMVREAGKAGKLDYRYSGPGYHQRVLDTQAVFAEFEVPEWPFLYFSGSLYSETVTRFENYNPGRVKTMLFEEFVRDPRAAISEVLDFVGVAQEELFDSGINTYQTRAPAGPLGHFVRSIGAPSWLKTWGPAGNRLADLLERKVYGKPKLTISQYNRAKKLLFNEYDYWSRREPRSSQHWRFLK